MNRFLFSKGAFQRTATYSTILQHNTTNCNTANSATHCNTLQHTYRISRGEVQEIRLFTETFHHAAMHCNRQRFITDAATDTVTFHHSTSLMKRPCVCCSVCCSALQCDHRDVLSYCNALHQTAPHCNALQHAATHCNISLVTQRFHHTAMYCNTLQHITPYCNALQHPETYSNVLQHTTTHYTILQHTGTHCTTRQQTERHYNTLHLQHTYIP